MHKNGFTIVEVVMVFLLILGVAFFIVPKNLESTRQAKLISLWSEKYSQLEYTFSVIKAQKDSEMTEKLLGEHDNDGKEKVILDTIKPYMRITSEVTTPYKQYYMNGTEIIPRDKNHFDNCYLTSSGEIIGFKLVNSDCEKKEVCAIMSFDLNGDKGPNKWGYDIYGINVLKNGIEPLGKGIDSDMLRNNCTRYGSGLYCSYYYLIGGRFD